MRGIEILVTAPKGAGKSYLIDRVAELLRCEGYDVDVRDEDFPHGGVIDRTAHDVTIIERRP